MAKALQNEREIAAFVELVSSEKARSYLEIGSKFGGSLYRVAMAMPKGSRVVSVDLPSGTKDWKQSELSLRSVITSLKATGYDAHLILGVSQDENVIAKVKALGPYDCVFIDADHRLPGVTADWENYGPMGKMVVFHDIAWKRPADWAGYHRIDVPQFWNSIKGEYRHREFVYDPTGEDNGIGVLWR